MKSLIQVVVSLFALYLFVDTFLYYLDCDILNVLPEHDTMKLTALSLAVLSLYLMCDSDNKKGE